MDSFPNSDQLFKEALLSSDPLPTLLQLIKDHPNWRSLTELIVVYDDLVHQDPSRGPALASIIARLIQAPDAPNIGSHKLEEEMRVVLSDAHFKFEQEEEVKEYGPKNTYLIDSLLSGLSLYHNFAASNDQVASIHDGLQPPLSGSHVNHQPEVELLGACIQLLMGGSVLSNRGTYKMSPETVAEKLKVHKKAGTLKDPQAIKFLDLTITHAETGLKGENNRVDVWELLFPSQE